MRPLLFSLLLLPSAVANDVFEATVTIKYIKLQEANRCFRQVFEEKVRTQQDEDRLSLSASNLSQLSLALRLLAAIDLPTGSPTTYWLELKHITAKNFADEVERLSEDRFGQITVTPDPRTNRIFLICSIENKDWVEGLLKKWDRPRKK